MRLLPTPWELYKDGAKNTPVKRPGDPVNNGSAGIAAVSSHGFSGIFCLREMCFILQSCVLFEGKQRCMLTLGL